MRAPGLRPGALVLAPLRGYEASHCDWALGGVEGYLRASSNGHNAPVYPRTK
jgi:hypothetical protein